MLIVLPTVYEMHPKNIFTLNDLTQIEEVVNDGDGMHFRTLAVQLRKKIVESLKHNKKEDK